LAVNPVVICLSRSGQITAQKIAQAFGYVVHGRKTRVDQADAYFDNALDHIRDLFAAKTPVIGVCASGILIRAVAPLLNDKTAEPPVVSVADDGSTVVPLLGGHRGANRLAKDLAEMLSGHAAVTTAGDVALGVALDTPPLGWRLANPENAKGVMAGLLSGGAAKSTGENIWGLDSNPDGMVTLITTEESVAGDDTTLVYHPQKITLGVGCARNCDPQELWQLVQKTFTDNNIALGCVAAIGSLDLKADEPAMNMLAERLGVPFRVFTAQELEAHASQLANPSDVVFAEVGCHGVSEAAALALGNTGANLKVAKRKTKNATCALAISAEPITKLKGRTRGKLSIIGIGPGQASWRTPEASQLVAEAQELVGYGLYIDLLGPLAFGKERSDFHLGAEEDRCRYALEQAAKGKNVALICSGDAGIYAMGALVFELMDRSADEMGVSDAAHRVEIKCTPGVSALQGAAARAGAPLGHDFCAISLSDLLTHREDIIKRLQAAAIGDFVIAFYNPVSKRRRTLLAEARDILLQHRPKIPP
jgi:cobalt-precorrin 5A hydrolase/precorrin-3B C17-methyltransferase